MRVALVGACPFPSPQGSQVYLGGMARALSEAGVDVTVVAYAHGQGDVPRGVRVVRGPAVAGYARLRSGPDLAKPALDLALANVLARVDVDVVHAHGHEGMGVAFLARQLRGSRGRPPLVYTPHTLFGEELPTYVRGEARVHGMARDALAVLGRWSDGALPRHADACVALSERSAAHLRGLGLARVEVVTPGLFPEDVAPRRTLPPGRPVIVYAGNPDGYQDLPVLVEAMARVRAACGEAAPHLRLVGASWRDSEDGRAIAAAADEVVATADWPTARAAIATATVAAVPRTRCAGFPVKLLAALALGVPVVVAEGSAQGLPGEIVVRNGDPAVLADALLAACDTPVTTDLAALVARCGWSSQVSRLLAVYGSFAM